MYTVMCVFITYYCTCFIVNNMVLLYSNVCGNAGDRYNDEAARKDYVEDDEWETGNKSAAEEAIERVQEIVGKGLEDSDEQRWLVHSNN